MTVNDLCICLRWLPTRCIPIITTSYASNVYLNDMGNLFMRALDALSGTKEKKILLLGLDAAGANILAMNAVILDIL